MGTFAIYKDNDNLIELDGLTNAATDAYLNSATVTLTKIMDSLGATVTGDTFPKSMSYVAASNGKYQASVDKLLALTAGAAYTAVIDASYSGIDGHWEIPLLCGVRKG